MTGPHSNVQMAHFQFEYFLFSSFPSTNGLREQILIHELHEMLLFSDVRSVVSLRWTQTVEALTGIGARSRILVSPRASWSAGVCRICSRSSADSTVDLEPFV